MKGTKGMEAHVSIELTGVIPSKKNSRVNTRSGRSFPGKEYTKWHRYALIELKRRVTEYEARGVSFPLTECGLLTLNVLFPDGRRRDLDNALSSVLDTLKDAGIIRDDNWKEIREINVKGNLREKAPGAVIYIEGHNG